MSRGRFSRRRVGAAAAVAAAVSLVAACGSDDGNTASAGSDSQVVHAAYFGFSSASEPSTIAFKAFQEKVEAAGGTAEFFDGKYDATVQVGQVQDALTSKKYNVFVIGANDGAALAPVAKRAIAQGVKVIADYTPLGSKVDTVQPQLDGLVTTVATPLVTDGVNLAKLMVQACAGKNPCNTAFLIGQRSAPFDAVKLQSFQTEIAKTPSVKVKAVREGGYSQDSGRKAGQDLLQAFSDLDVIGTSGDQSAIGVRDAVKPAGTATSPLIYGYGASVGGIDGIKDGTIYGTILFVPQNAGQLEGQAALDAVAGRTVETSLDPQAGLAADKGYPVIITKDNLPADFTPQWNG